MVNSLWKIFISIIFCYIKQNMKGEWLTLHLLSINKVPWLKNNNMQNQVLPFTTDLLFTHWSVIWFYRYFRSGFPQFFNSSHPFQCPNLATCVSSGVLSFPLLHMTLFGILCAWNLMFMTWRAHYSLRHKYVNSFTNLI